ncbi:hypothetical protein Dimus_039544 [Dionaea muscipula]
MALISLFSYLESLAPFPCVVLMSLACIIANLLSISFIIIIKYDQVSCRPIDGDGTYERFGNRETSNIHFLFRHMLVVCSFLGKIGMLRLVLVTFDQVKIFSPRYLRC